MVYSVKIDGEKVGSVGWAGVMGIGGSAGAMGIGG